MASHQQPSPTAGLPRHGIPPPGHPQPNGHGHGQLPVQAKNASEYLRQQNEEVWLSLGQLSEQLGDVDGAQQCYEHALRHNTWSVRAMNSIASILRTKENFPTAVEYLQNILKIDPNNGEVWGSLGHCYLMMEDLQQAYSSYQQALYHLQDPKEPKLWYGIGILYDRYGSLEHAEEAFSQVMRMEPSFEKANEIYFRLGIIYKQQQKFQQSLECFKYIVHDPPRPLTEEDIWFQIGHVHEQQKDFEAAKAAYKRVLERDPNHAKVLQQLGWLYHQENANTARQEQAIEYLEKSVASDQTDAQSWYLLGRCYMAMQKYPKAYEAYQQAVYRDGRNPTFWCSIGVLYYQINQYRDALDAYSRAIRLNPHISEVWYDLGTLYESCNNQTADALDAYQRAAELDPTNVHIKARLQLLQNGQPTSGMPNQNSQPLPQDVHPQAYQPQAMNGPPGPQWNTGSHQAQPAPPPPTSDWPRRLAGIQDPQMPPQQLTPYDQRDAVRPPTSHPPPPRPASPRQEPSRPYQEPPRVNPPPPLRRVSPSPKTHNAAPSVYQVPQSVPQAPPPPQSQVQQAPQPPTRIANPNYGGHAASHSSSVPPPPTTGITASATQGPLPPYSRITSPTNTEPRPLVDNRPPSATGLPHQAYPHHPPSSLAGTIAGGPPAPPPAPLTAQAAEGMRQESTPTGAKRHREWEDDASQAQKPVNDEKRARLDDPVPRRPSPPQRIASPPRRDEPNHFDARRPEEPRRTNDGYHPSEAAHHPPSLPSINSSQQLPPINEAPKEERRDHHEPAARKMEVDEDYDDSGEDEKRNIPPISEKSSPHNPATQNGVAHPPVAAEAKA